MKSLMFFLSFGFVFSAVLVAEATVIESSTISEYVCDGEDSERSFFASLIFENDFKVFKMNFSQATQHDEGPYPLLPLRYQLRAIDAKMLRHHRVFEFAPANYQSCSYRWFWPLQWNESEDVRTTLKLDCDGNRSEIELTCVKTEADVHQYL